MTDTTLKAEDFRAAGVTVAVLNFNGIQILGDCFDSIVRLSLAPGELIMVDDGSSDCSPDWVRTQYPQVRVIELGENTKRLNKVRNRALREARHDLVLIVDNDVRLHEGCLEALLAALRTLPDAAVCMPRALYDHDPEIIYQDGQVLHYVAASHALNRGLRASQTDEAARVSLGWGVQLINRRKAAEVEYFNEGYEMGWGDDGEFNHKMNLAGHLCYHVPTAVVYHKRVTAAGRYAGAGHNRWRFILETYQLRTLLLCLPALLTFDLALLGFLVLKGAAGGYLRAIGRVAVELPEILATRRRVQARRKVSDSQLFTGQSVFVASEFVNSRPMALGFGLLNGFLSGYWRLVRPLLPGSSKPALVPQTR